MKKKDLANLALALGILPHVLSSKKGSRAFGPKVSKYLGLPPVTISYADGSRMRKSVQPGVDVANMWKLAAESTYATGDMTLIAIREALQNSFDAIDQLSKRERNQEGFVGQFFVVWIKNTDGTVDLLLQDNGIGMSDSDIENRFLVLGGDGGKSQSSRGGFGFAKASILFLAAKFEFEIRTRNYKYVSTSFGSDGYLDDEEMGTPFPYRKGTQILLKNIKTEFMEKYTNQVLEAALRSPPRGGARGEIGSAFEWDRIAQFLSLNVFDTEKYNITFFVYEVPTEGFQGNVKYFSWYQSGSNQDPQALEWLTESIGDHYGAGKTWGGFDWATPEFLSSGHIRNMEDGNTGFPRPFAVTWFGAPEGIPFMIDGKGNITETSPTTKQYWGFGAEYVIRGFNEEQFPLANKIEPETLPVIVAIQGQVQFITDYRFETKRKLPFRLLYLDLFPTVRAVEKDYPLDVSRLRLTDNSKLRTIVDAIKRSTEQVKDLFDAFYYKCGALDLLNWKNEYLDETHDYSESYSDEKYRIIGTSVGMSHYDDERASYEAFPHCLFKQPFPVREKIPEIFYNLDNWAITNTSGSMFLDPEVANELRSLIGGFDFLIPYINILIGRDDFYGRLYWTNFLISVWAIQYLSEGDLVSSSLWNQREKEEVTAQLERIKLLGFPIGAPVSKAKAQEIFRVFCPLVGDWATMADTDYFIPVKGRGGVALYVTLNSCVYGMNLFNLYVGRMTNPESLMRRFLYSISLLRSKIFCSKVFASWDNNSWWQNSNRTFTPGYEFSTDRGAGTLVHGDMIANPEFYVEHTKRVERLLPPLFKERYPELKDFTKTVWGNPLFGLANIRCDYGDSVELVRGDAITAYLIWFCGVYESVYQLKKKSAEAFMESDVLRNTVESFMSDYYFLYTGIIFDDPGKLRRGKEKTGIPMAANRNDNHRGHTLLINPILWQKLRKKSKDANILAILLLRTIAHEIAHQTQSYHNEEFLMADSVIFQELVVLGVPITLAEKIIPKLDYRIKAPVGSKSQIARQQKRAIELTKNYRYCSRHK